MTYLLQVELAKLVLVIWKDYANTLENNSGKNLNSPSFSRGKNYYNVKQIKLRIYFFFVILVLFCNILSLPADTSSVKKKMKQN